MEWLECENKEVVLLPYFIFNLQMYILKLINI